MAIYVIPPSQTRLGGIFIFKIKASERVLFNAIKQRKEVMRVKKLFISQPMRDKTDEQIKVERKNAIKKATELLGEEVEVIDSFFESAPHDARPLWFLGKSMELLSTADVAYFVNGWENYRGCRIENTCAKEYGIKVIEE